jgi:hypothetical protein
MSVYTLIRVSCDVEGHYEILKLIGVYSTFDKACEQALKPEPNDPPTLDDWLPVVWICENQVDNKSNVIDKEHIYTINRDATCVIGFDGKIVYRIEHTENTENTENTADTENTENTVGTENNHMPGMNDKYESLRTLFAEITEKYIILDEKKQRILGEISKIHNIITDKEENIQENEIKFNSLHEEYIELISEINLVDKTRGDLIKQINCYMI